MSLAGEWTVLQMRMVTGEKPGPGRVFGNLRTPSSGSVLDAMTLRILARAAASCRRDCRRGAGATFTLVRCHLVFSCPNRRRLARRRG
jgi:hypothetical protein